MSENEIAVVETKALTAADVKAQVNLVQEVMQAVMQDGTHFGKVPGCGDKPTLLKAGAEKLMMTFRLAANVEAHDISGPDAIRYRVKVNLTHQGTGNFIGSGIGEASTDEAKFCWRNVIHTKEFDATPENRRRIKFDRNGNEYQQVRTNPSDLANTVLKMAKKRALVDAVLTATAASDIFAQDLEDLPEDQKRSSATSPSTSEEGATDVAVFTPEEVRQQTGTSKKTGKAFTRYIIVSPDGEEFSTFDIAKAEVARTCRDEKLALQLTYKTTKFGLEVLDVKAGEPIA